MLKRQGIAQYELRASMDHQVREFCVQAGETDLEFIARLAAEEGFIYRFEHSEKLHKLIITDRLQSLGLISHGVKKAKDEDESFLEVDELLDPDTVLYQANSGGAQAKPCLQRLRYSEQVRTARQVQRDYTFTNDRKEQVNNDESILIGRDRTETVGNDERVTIGHDAALDIGRNQTIKIAKDRIEAIGNHRHDQIAANHHTSIGGNLEQQVEGHAELEARGEIRRRTRRYELRTAEAVIIQGPGGSIRIDETGITLDSPTIRINGQMLKSADGATNLFSISGAPVNGNPLDRQCGRRPDGSCPLPDCRCTRGPGR